MRPETQRPDRTQYCWDGVLTFTFLSGTTPVGELQALLVQYISLNPRSDVWTEYDTVTKTQAAGSTAAVDISLTASCKLPCEATAEFNGKIFAGLSGQVVYLDTIGDREEHETPTHYKLSYSSPARVSLGDPTWTSPHSYRCDKGVAEAGTGCVFPSFIPTLELSKKKYGASAAMIQWAQQHMSGHWGSEAHKAKMTRVSGEDGDKNRNRVCDGTFKNQGKTIGTPPGGKGGTDSCDEFPFASSGQSGAAKLGR